MATSGSTNYTVSRNEIITEALQIAGAHDAADATPGEEVTAAARTLNLMIKGLVTKAPDLFFRNTVTLFLVSGTESYTLSTAHATESYVETDVRVSGGTGDTTLEVDSTTGMTAADYIGVKLDTGAIHWTTIDSITDTDTLVLATALPSAVAVDNNVYTYTTKAPEPKRIMNAYRRDTSGNDSPVALIGWNEYSRLSDKNASGSVTQIHYGQNGKLYVWPATDTAIDKLVLTYESNIEDFDSSGDNPDFPSEWYETLAWQLAARLSVKYGLPMQDRSGIWAIADRMLQDALDYDTTNAPVKFELGIQ